MENYENSYFDNIDCYNSVRNRVRLRVCLLKEKDRL